MTAFVLNVRTMAITGNVVVCVGHTPFFDDCTEMFLLSSFFVRVSIPFSLCIMRSGMGAIFRVAAAISPVRIAIAGGDSSDGDSSNNGATTVPTAAGEADTTTGTNSGADSGNGADSADSATEEVKKAPNPVSEDSETVSSDLTKAEENRPASAASKQSSCSCFNHAAVILVVAMMMVFQ
jgi:hypothetical protein